MKRLSTLLLLAAVTATAALTIFELAVTSTVAQRVDATDARTVALQRRLNELLADRPKGCACTPCPCRRAAGEIPFNLRNGVLPHRPPGGVGDN